MPKKRSVVLALQGLRGLAFGFAGRLIEMAASARRLEFPAFNERRVTFSQWEPSP